MTGGQTLEELIRTDRETFRATAMDALALFTPEDRDLAASLLANRGKTTAGDLFYAWRTELRPLYEELEDLSEDPKFKTYLTKKLHFREDDADMVIEDVLDARRDLALHETIQSVYPHNGDDTPYQHAYAGELLSRPLGAVDDYFDRYHRYHEALDLADKHSITLCDPHASWLDRQKAAMQINKERQRMTAHEDARLDEIADQMQTIVADDDSIVARVIDYGWDYTAIMDLRQKYQRQVDSLTKSEQKNPTKLLKIFERVTKTFREKEAERAVERTKRTGLRDLQRIHEAIYELLLEIFDQSNAQRNYLLLEIQRHHKLRQERDLILLVQRNREHFISSKHKA